MKIFLTILPRVSPFFEIFMDQLETFPFFPWIVPCFFPRKRPGVETNSWRRSRQARLLEVSCYARLVHDWVYMAAAHPRCKIMYIYIHTICIISIWYMIYLYDIWYIYMIYDISISYMIYLWSKYPLSTMICVSLSIYLVHGDLQDLTDA